MLFYLALISQFTLGNGSEKGPENTFEKVSKLSINHPVYFERSRSQSCEFSRNKYDVLNCIPIILALQLDHYFDQAIKSEELLRFGF